MTGNYAKKMIPEALRLWELSRMGIAAWAVAGSVGYVLWDIHPPAPEDPSFFSFGLPL